MTHCKWCHGRSIVEIKMAVDGGDGRKCVMFFLLPAAAGAFWFKRISGSAQGYSLPDTVQNNTPGPYFLEEHYALHPLFLLFPLTLTIGEVIRHECRGLWHEWMSSCNAPMTFCNSLLDLQKRLEGGKRQMEKKENTKKRPPLKSLEIFSSVTTMWYCLPCLTQSRCLMDWLTESHYLVLWKTGGNKGGDKVCVWGLEGEGGWKIKESSCREKGWRRMWCSEGMDVSLARFIYTAPLINNFIEQ